jgi:type I restriction enzyme S subunit
VKLRDKSEFRKVAYDWIGEIPNDWSVFPLKSLCSNQDAVFTDGDWIESDDIESDGTIRYLTSGNVGPGIYKDQGASFITEQKFKELNCTEVLPGDILISRLNLPVGRACIVPAFDSKIVTCVDNVIFRPNSTISRKFITYLLSADHHFANTKNLARGTTMQRISGSSLGKIRFAIPNLSEQEKIANFLDRETAKIDELIQKQEKIIWLLNEEIQSTISLLMVRGLNPDIEFIDSGVDWLGKIPKHWNVKKFKYCASLVQDKTSEKTNVIALENIEGWTGNLIETESDYEGDGIAFEGGDVLFGKLRPYLAKVLFAKNNGQAFGDILVFKAKKDLYPGYLFRTMLNSEFIKLVNSSTYGTKMPRANWDFIGNIKIAVPPIDEQIEIANKINAKVLICEKLTTKAKQSIELLKEHRKSLVSAAVTGKIDVRELV